MIGLQCEIIRERGRPKEMAVAEVAAARPTGSRSHSARCRCALYYSS